MTHPLPFCVRAVLGDDHLELPQPAHGRSVGARRELQEQSLLLIRKRVDDLPELPGEKTQHWFGLVRTAGTPHTQHQPRRRSWGPWPCREPRTRLLQRLRMERARMFPQKQGSRTPRPGPRPTSQDDRTANPEPGRCVWGFTAEGTHGLRTRGTEVRERWATATGEGFPKRRPVTPPQEVDEKNSIPKSKARLYETSPANTGESMLYGRKKHTREIWPQRTGDPGRHVAP